jgi:ketosteroid isomerase-like protein
MSKDITSLDILAEAHLPSDLMTPSLGSNYGMDGYPDMQYGMGVLDAVFDQDLQPSPAFPTGVQKGASVEAMDLSGMMGENLADLDWLDPSQLPALERLPESPESIPELVDAWGVHRRTDGINVASHQTDLAYARGTQNLSSPKKKATTRTIEKVVTHAMRRSIEGQHIGRVVKEAAESMGYEMERVVPLLRRVAEDHGLAGRVFIRASAYPGWGTGKWKNHAKKHAKEAKYIVVSKRDKKQAVWIQNGRCAFTGKLAVTEVPWDKAHKFYAPRLEATGRRVASGDERNSLREAFLSQPFKPEADAGYLPTHKTPDQRVSSEEARKQFASHESKRVVLENTKHESRRRSAAVSKIMKMERDSIIPAGSAKKIASSGVGPVEMLKRAARLASGSKKSVYSTNTEKNAQSLFSAQQSDRRSLANQERNTVLRKASNDKAMKSVKAMLKKGQTTESRVRELMASHKDIRKVASVLSQEVALSSVESREYKGSEFVSASLNNSESMSISNESTELMKVAQAGDCSVAEIEGMLRTLKKAMSEGMAGRDLDHYLSNRFSNRLMKAASGLVSKEREEHEGLAGFVYVEASAYASTSGTKGCDAGGLKHRANQIPSVRKMARCSSCTLARCMPDGTIKCGAYNKILVGAKDLSGDETAKIKKANIKSSNMTDAEATASLFAPAYDPSEFGLSNNNLEDVNFSSVENEKMAEVVFGDWEIGF